jgi:hypothetical protein
MQKNEILEKILDAYCNAFTALSDDQKTACRHFCEYASEWLAESGVVGVGQTAEGVSLRFSDGQERLLFSAASTPMAPAGGVAVSITGNSSGNVRGSSPVADSSVKITG